MLPKYPDTDGNWVGKDHGIHVGAVGVILRDRREEPKLGGPL